jgi:uncharacterized RDD family membrane protein YckC
MNEPHLASADFGGFWIRFLAVLVDSAIVFVVMALIIAGGATLLGAEMVALATLAAWLFGFLYWPVMHATGLQATFGKAILRLRVTGYQGSRISLLRSLGRELSKILSGAVMMLGYIIAGFTARKQALHDLVASTLVVREGKPRIVLALATFVAGLILPVVLVPMLAAPAMMSSLTAMMGSLEQMGTPEHIRRTPVKPPVVVAKPTAPPPPAPAVLTAPPPVPVAPPPVQIVKAEPAPAPVAQVAVPAPPVPPTPVIVPKRIEPQAAEEPTKAEKKAEPKKVEPKKVVSRKAPTVVETKAASGPKFNDLVTAVLYRDAHAVSELLKLGRWADKPDSRGSTPLMLAVEMGDAGSAEALLKGGADPARAVPVAAARRDGAMLDLLKRYAAR